MRTLVTGATGMVGANLVRELLAQGHRVAVLIRPTSDRSALNGLNVQYHVGDILDQPTVRDAVDGVEIVFHAAAVYSYTGYTQQELDAVAVVGTGNVLTAAADASVKRVVLTSSSVVFGSSTVPCVHDESSIFAETLPPKYVLSKKRQHEVAFEMARAMDLELLAVCPTVAIGAHDYKLNPSNAVISNFLNDPWRSTFLGGCNIVSATDVAKGHILVAGCGASGESYVLGAENLTWRDLHRQIANQCSLTGPWFTLNNTSTYLIAAATEWQSRLAGRSPPITLDQARMVGRYYWYSHAKAQGIGFAPTMGSRVISQALAWLCKTNHVNRFVRDSIVLNDGLMAVSTK